MIAYHHFINHTPERAGRVYSLWLQQDLFGQWTLMRVQGGRHREPVLHSQVVESREAGGEVGEGTAAAWVCGEHKEEWASPFTAEGPQPLGFSHSEWIVYTR